MNNPIYFVSDNHFQKRNNSSENSRRLRFYSLLDEIESKKGSLVIGGDFLDFWFDYSGYVPLDYLDIFERLNLLKNSGCSIYYVLGNHDYWDFGFFGRVFAKEVIKDQYNVSVDGHKIRVIHGDGVFRSDYFYRLFRSIIRSRLCTSLFSLLSPSMGYYISSIISQADQHNSYYRENDNLKDRLKEYAKGQWVDCDTILVGHYHQTGIVEYEGKRLIFMGDWLSKYTVTVYEKGEWRQLQWD